MSDPQSGIHRAFEEFKAKYSWDKSLQAAPVSAIVGQGSLPISSAAQTFEDNSLAEFTRSQQAKQQSDSL